MIKKYNIFLESKKKFPDIKTLNYEGFTINMGKDAKSNDHLTFIESDDDDLWFHVKGYPGSHVVIKVKDKLPTDDIIEYVAKLAKKNSKGKNENEVDVVYCKRKFVTKKKDMVPGQVHVDKLNANFKKV